MKLIQQEIQFQTYWSVIINIILKCYFSDKTTCLIWPQDEKFNLHIETDNVFINIWPKTLEKAFEQDIFNHTSIEMEHQANGIHYGKWIKKLLASIQQSHCESFIVFQQDIPIFMEAFVKASVYSIWRSIRNRFLFVYYGANNTKNYFQRTLMQKQAEILIVYADFINSSNFHLKTNKFVGSIFDQPEELYTVTTFDAKNRTNNVLLANLYNREKLKNLQGREVIVGVPDYPPFVVINGHDFPQYYDYSENNIRHSVHLDGIDIRVILTFCKMYNCTIQTDTSEKYDWGTTHLNYTGRGIIGLMAKKRTEVSIGVMYQWYNDYRAVDMSIILGRSGITLLVPAASRVSSWLLPLKPFQFTLWLAIIICLVAESLSLFLAHYYQQQQNDYGNKNGNKNGQQQLTKNLLLYSWQFGYITTLKLFISQTTNYVATSHTIRILLFACYMNNIIVTSIYSGVLSSILTLPILADAPDTVQGLYDFNLKWAGNSLAWIKSIMDSNSTIYKRLVRNFHIENTREMMESVNAKKFMGFGVERTIYGHFGETEFVTVQALSYLKLMLEDIYYEYTITLVERLWPYLSIYNDLVLALHSSGLFKYWEWEVSADYLNISIQNQIKASKYNNIEIVPIPLDMSNFAGIIIWWLLGIIFSILTFFGELFWHKWCLNNNKPTTCKRI